MDLESNIFIRRINVKFFKSIILTLTVCLLINTLCFAQEKNFWQYKNFNSESIPEIIHYNNNFLMSSGSLYISSDGNTWDDITLHDTQQNYTNITNLNEKLYAYGQNSSTLISNDGTSWNIIRLHNNILPKDIYFMGNNYFWVNKEKELMYSSSLLIWEKLNLPVNTPIEEIHFFENRCIFSTLINSSLKYWVIDENLKVSETKGDFNSLENIYYIPSLNKYISIINSSGKLTLISSNDLITWDKRSLKINNVNLNNFNSFYTSYVNNKLFLTIDETSYVSENFSNWYEINNFTFTDNINYSNKYYYYFTQDNILYISSNCENWYKYDFSNFTDNISKVYLIENMFYIINSKYDIYSQNYNNTLYSYNIDNIENIPITFPNSLTLQIGKSEMLLNNEQTIAIDEKNDVFPITQDGNTLIPIRAVITAIGGSIEWISDSNSILINCMGKSLTVSLNNNIAYLDGNELILPTAPKIISQRTLLPVRAIMEALGYEVEWINNTQKLIIYYN